MIKYFLLVSFILPSLIFSQEIHSIYRFKKVKSKNFNYLNLDSLVLYKSKKFYRKKYLQYHEINNQEEKGNWIIKNDSLFLNVTKEIGFNNKWRKINTQERLLLKRSKIISYNPKKKCLKLIK